MVASIHMGTLVSIEAAASEADATLLSRALEWFAAVERICSRFDPKSELRRLTATAGRPVPVSTVLYEATRFALALAEVTGGAFDPTVGAVMLEKGFNRHYVTGEETAAAPECRGASYRDVELNAWDRSILLHRPLMLDLGAVAKGFAIDLAAHELSSLSSFCIEAGGDLYVKGTNAAGKPWQIGVQDPRNPDAIAYLLEVSDRAVCTSGDYERRTADGSQHHLVHPRSGRPAAGIASVTVVAPSALAADGLSTAVFVLGPRRGLRLLRPQGAEGLIITNDGALHATPGGGR